MDVKVYSVVVVVWALVAVLADDPKRDKRTVDLVLKSFADVFGYDVVKRISGLAPRQVATPKPTFFPPPVAPLPAGPYSRIILTLGGAQAPAAEQTTIAPVKVDAPVAAVQSAGMFPILLTQGQVMPMSMIPVAQTQFAAPQSAPAAMAPVATPVIISSGAAVMTPLQQTPNAAQAAAPAPAPAAPAAAVPAAPAAPAQAAPAPASPSAPETPQVPIVTIQTGAPAAPQQEANPGVVVNQQGPLRWTLFTAPPRLAETVRRTLNFNLNWDRNVEPLGPALTAQLQTTAVQVPSPSQAPQTQPQTQPQPVPAPADAQPAAPQTQTTPAPTPSKAPEAAPQVEGTPKNDQANNDQNNQNQITPSREDPSPHFKQAIADFWRTSPWNSNNNNEDAPRDDDRRQSYQEEPEVSRYEEYDIEPVERIPVARPENNYRLKVNVPLPEENGYYEKEEFVKEETKSPRKVRKNVSQKNTRSTKVKRQRKKNSDDLKADRSRRVATTLYDDGAQNVVQPEFSGVVSKQLHNVYKREKSDTWPVPETQAAGSEETEVKNYYKKWRSARDVYGQQHYSPESYNTDFSYTVPESKVDHDAPLRSAYSYKHEFPDKARFYSKQSGKKETLFTSNKESKDV